MKILNVLLSLAVIVTVAGRHIRDTSDNEVSEDYDEDYEDEDLIDLTHLGSRLYGEPDEANGKRLLDWDESKALNPEEVGTYLEGDILLPKGQGRSGLIEKSSRWPGGVIPYVIEGNFNSVQMATLQSAFKAYHDKTCIRFVKKTDQKDYIRIKGDNTGCWSSVGRVGGGQVVNLQREGCMSKVGTPIHELMHAVGFLHEQNRADRDAHVNIRFSNIQKGLEGNFDKGSTSSTTTFGVPYDYGSVMHYSMNAFSSNGQPTIVAKQPTNKEMGQRDAFGQTDIWRINRMYECKNYDSGPGPNPSQIGARPAGAGGNFNGPNRPNPNGPVPFPSGPGPNPNGPGPYPNGQGPYPNGQGPYPNGQGPYPNGPGGYPNGPGGPYPNGPGGPYPNGPGGPYPNGPGGYPNGPGGPYPNGPGPFPSGPGPSGPPFPSGPGPYGGGPPHPYGPMIQPPSGPGPFPNYPPPHAFGPGRPPSGPGPFPGPYPGPSGPYPGGPPHPPFGPGFYPNDHENGGNATTLAATPT